MKSSTEAIVERAQALVGTRFRAQGRDPDMGLDCVGLVLCVYRLPIEEVRRDYRLRGPHRRTLECELASRFRRVVPERRRAGDVLLCAVSADQMHLAVDCGASFIHADAWLRKVVQTPGQPPWPVIAAFRSRSSISIAG